MPNLIRLTSGAVGILPGSAVAVFGDSGCRPCCGGGGGGPAICCVQVAPDGSQCGLVDAPDCGVTVTGSISVRSTGYLRGVLVPNAGGTLFTLVNLTGHTVTAPLTGHDCQLTNCSYGLAWGNDAGLAQSIIVPDGSSGWPWQVTSRQPAACTGSTQIITDSARQDAPPAGLWRFGNATARRGVLFEVGAGGFASATPNVGRIGGAPRIPGLYMQTAANIIRTTSAARPSQSWADATLIADSGTGERVLAADSPAERARKLGWNVSGGSVTEASVTGSTTVTRSGCTTTIQVNATGRFSGTVAVPQANWAFFQSFEASMVHELSFTLTTSLASCTGARGVNPLDQAAIDLLGSMG